jgi:hypothetical protein
MRALGRTPAYRAASGAVLERLLGNDAPESPTEALPTRRARAPRRRRDGGVHLHHFRTHVRLVLAVLVLAAAAGAIAAAVLVSGGGSSPPSFPPDRANQPARQAKDLAEWLRASSK